MPWYACPAPAGFLTQTIEDFARVHHNCIRGKSLHDRLRVLAFIAAAFSMAVSVAVLFGWAFRIPQLTGMAVRFVTMKPATAISFLLCNASSIRSSPPSPSVRAPGWDFPSSTGLLAVTAAQSPFIANLVRFLFPFVLSCHGRLGSCRLRFYSGSDPSRQPRAYSLCR